MSAQNLGDYPRRARLAQVGDVVTELTTEVVTEILADVVTARPLRT
ncbi:MAG: hypothetical protein RL591_2535 [Planctomycetota bacterium]